MTFFGKDRTKTGLSLYFSLLTIGMTAFGWNAKAAGYSTPTVFNDYAATVQFPSQQPSQLNPGFNTPPTVQSNGKQTSFVYPSQVQYATISPDGNTQNTEYRVKNDLSLEVTRHYSFTITPTQENVELLRDGWYKVRAVIVLPNVEYLNRERMGLESRLSDEARYVTSQKALGHYTRNNNTLRVKLDFKFSDISVMWIRSNLYLEMTPIDSASLKFSDKRVDPINSDIVEEKNGPHPLVTISQIIPFRDLDARPAVIADQKDSIAADLDAYVVRAKRLLNQNTNANINATDYANAAHLKFFDLRSADLDQSLQWRAMQLPAVEKNLNRAQLGQLLQVSPGTYVQPLPNQLDPTLARAFCVEAAKQQTMSRERFEAHVLPWITKCSFYPYYYLNIQKNVHVISLGNEAYGTERLDVLYQIIANFSFNKSRSTDLFFNFTASPSNLYPLSGLGTGLGYLPVSLSAGASQSVSESITNSGVGQTFTSMKIRPISARLPIQRYQACLSVAIDRRKADFPISTHGLYICDEAQARPLSLSENFYFLFQDANLQEQASPQAINLLFRGDRDASAFLRIGNNFVRSVDRNQLLIGNTFGNAQDIYSRMPGPATGVVSLPMAPTNDIQFEKNPGPVVKKNWWQKLRSLATNEE
jgi:hypothetical protein